MIIMNGCVCRNSTFAFGFALEALCNSTGGSDHLLKANAHTKDSLCSSSGNNQIKSREKDDTKDVRYVDDTLRAPWIMHCTP